MARRESAIERDGLFCRYCGDAVHPSSFVLDHVLARHRGGPDGLSNRVIACKPCDRLKGDLTLAELGWSLLPPRGVYPRANMIRDRPPKRPSQSAGRVLKPGTRRAERAAIRRAAQDEVSQRRAVVIVERERKSFAIDGALFPPYVVPVGRSDKRG